MLLYRLLFESIADRLSDALSCCVVDSSRVIKSLWEKDRNSLLIKIYIRNLVDLPLNTDLFFLIKWC